MILLGVAGASTARLLRDPLAALEDDLSAFHAPPHRLPSMFDADPTLRFGDWHGA